MRRISTLTAIAGIALTGFSGIGPARAVETMPPAPATASAADPDTPSTATPCDHKTSQCSAGGFIIYHPNT